jgi:hypothetical protein
MHNLLDLVYRYRYWQLKRSRNWQSKTRGWR